MKLIELAFFTDQVDSMAEFYQRLLGTEPVARSDGMANFTTGGVQIFIHASYSPEEEELSAEDHTAFQVDDVDAVCLGLIDKGLIIERPPQDYYWGRSAYMRDPSGHQIEITEELK